ncbi:DNA primase [Candidatus Saccharibacteria bacterium]|nr:DNA primase [Candidatus Saccharibacteria bacterium]
MYDLKEEIKSRLPIEDVVGRYVELKRTGRNLKGRSPWGVDKTPSFMVSPEKGIWHDFSANKGGDIFTFVMEVEGITFKEALEKLAHEAGLDPQKYGNLGGKVDQKFLKKKNRAKEALTLSTKYYQACLARSREVCEYVFYKRNLSRTTVAEFKIGYAPSSGHALIDALKKRGFTLEELASAGLLNRFEKDLFKNRMMIPFFDTSGQVIGYTARVLDGGEPKYLNTPETILFNKSNFIFGLFQAKEAIRRNNYVVIVEGNMDVISSHQAGIKTAVATSGTAMTTQHLKTLSRLTSDIRLAYDGDAAGVKATERAVELAGELGIDLTIISNYHGAKDPDELIQKDPNLWQQAVEERIPAVDWLLQKYAESLNLNLAPDKKKYSDIALHLLTFVKDEVERATYESKIAKRLGVSESVLREKSGRLEEELEKKSSHKLLKKPKTKITPDNLKKIEDNLLALKIFGHLSDDDIPLETPTDESRLSELELVFNNNYGSIKDLNYQKESRLLMELYLKELKKSRITSLNEKLNSLDDSDPAYEETLLELNQLLKI